jgi:enoyl-CoA hydratase/carnithine racemase
MILLGEVVDAATAHSIGLVNRVTAAGDALRVAREMAATIAGRAPLAVQEAKRAIDRAGDTSLDAGLATELDGSERLFSSHDMLEGARAFLEKRPPRFRGR